MTPFHNGPDNRDIHSVLYYPNPSRSRLETVSIPTIKDVAQSLTGWLLREAKRNRINDFSIGSGGILSAWRHAAHRYLLTGLLLCSLLPSAVLAAQAQSYSHEIETLEQQYLASRNPELRRQILGRLKLLAKSSPAGNADALNAAVSAMLPTAESTEEAEELLEIGTMNPAERPAGAPSLPEDTEFLVNARHAAQEAGDATGDVETLADIRIDHLQRDRLGHEALTSAHIQHIWRINTAQGTRNSSPRSIQFSGMTETLIIVRARVLKANGREIEATVSRDHAVVAKSASMYFDARARDLVLKPLEPGDLVEVEYYLLAAADVSPWAGYYARLDLFRDTFPARLRRRVIIAPTAMQLYAVTQELHALPVRQKGEETTRIWEAGAIAGPAIDLPAASASGPYLHVSTIGSMEELGRWYSERLEPGLQLDENLRTLAQQILERNLNTQAKVQAVYESVQHRTKYVALEFGVHSYLPYSVSTVGRRGFGDCKDKAAMIVALLRAVGVKAEFAMVRTRSVRPVATEAYSVQLFNHAMVFIPELNLYLDATAKYSATGEVPPKDEGAMAITVDAAGNATRRMVPFSVIATDRVANETSAALAGERTLEFASQKNFEHYPAAE